MLPSALGWSLLVVAAAAITSSVKSQEHVAEAIVGAEARSKIAKWLTPSELKVGLNHRVDDLITRLQQNPQTAKFLDLLYENKNAVYFSATCFIIGTSLLIVVLIFYNPLTPSFAGGKKYRRRFRLAERHENPELEYLIVKGNQGRDQSFALGAAGDMIPVQDKHINPLELSLREERGGASWGSTLAEAVVSQPRRGSDPFATIIELCKQKTSARFADVLELKRAESVYAFVGRNANSAVYRFRADTVQSIVRIIPVSSELVAEKECLLRGMLYLNRLHTSPVRFLCRNFVEIEGVAFVQDDYPTSLLKMVCPSGNNSSSPVQPAARDAMFNCRSFIVISMEVAGTPLSRCPIKNAAQAKSIVQQLCFTLAIGERFAAFCVDKADADKVYLKSTERGKIDFRLDGISVAVKLIDGVVSKLGGTSFTLGNVSLNENQLMEAAERRISTHRRFERNVEFVSRVVKLLLERVPREVDSKNMRNEQKVIFDLKDIESHLRNFDCVYKFTMFKFIQPRKSLAVVAVRPKASSQE